ncbi:MAG TPA: EamA family transporter [Methylomirabilota bacterium]|nr:EamA family transporter [Methylomirabilota bacterium]
MPASSLTRSVAADVTSSARGQGRLPSLIPWETLLATLALAPIALTIDPRPQVDWSSSLTLLLLYLGVAGTGVAYWAAATAGRLLPAVTTSLGLLATPMVSVITATLWLGEPLTVSHGAVIALVLAGVAIGAPRTAGAAIGRPA